MDWILDGKLAASSVPYSREDLRDWKRKGIRAVLNLLEEHEKILSDGVYIEEGFDYLNFPIRDMGAPDVDDLVRIVEWIDKKVNEGKKVLVHCYAGLGRTGTVIAAYLIYKFKYSPEKAIEFIRKRRPGSVQSFSQLYALEAFYRYINAKTK